ncbi:replication initiator protein [Blackfly microvirus SF02]|uniref:Replication initiator protein n=1 Tax=Blackfly microvirus SF02 TaxID=2576452 RepID=A0A4P8PTR9_9VIRU|nr:replication initiator protein [Blackfly microvirus SF02]
MSCVKPLRAYWRNAARDGITFDVAHSATKIAFGLPCGRCIGCRMEKARQWGLRCLHEKKMWKHNAYVTLTYDNDHLPPAGTLCLRDVQLFMKKLRKAKDSNKDNPLRFFLGGEYGEDNGRPHYHALLFNCNFPDKLFWSNNKRGEPLYVSKELTGLWDMGHCSIGEVTFDSAVYCAKYALKKVNGDNADEHYTVYDEDGVCHRRRSEFAVMSRRPGIGATYYDKYGVEVRSHDSIIVDGNEVRPPRFYDDRTKLLDSKVYDLNKKKRKRMAVLNRSDSTPERLRVKEKLMIIAAEKKERKL